MSSAIGSVLTDVIEMTFSGTIAFESRKTSRSHEPSAVDCCKST